MGFIEMAVILALFCVLSSPFWAGTNDNLRGTRWRLSIGFRTGLSLVPIRR